MTGEDIQRTKGQCEGAHLRLISNGCALERLLPSSSSRAHSLAALAGAQRASEPKQGVKEMTMQISLRFE